MKMGWSRRGVPWVLGLVALLLVAGCGGRRRAVVVQTGYAAGEFVVVNESGMTICYVNFSSSNDPNWGPDQLGPSEVINPGQVRGWQVAPDYYDFRLLDCSRRTLMERRGESIGAGARRTVTFRTPEW